MSLEVIKTGLMEAEWWIAIFTGLLFFVTATLAWFTYRLWKETKHAVLDTAESRRPWLHFELKPRDNVSSQFGFNSVHFDLIVTNLGLSPAINISIKPILEPTKNIIVEETTFYVDDKRFAKVEERLRGKKASNFNFFSFPNQRLPDILWIGNAEGDFDPNFQVGIAYVFIYYQTPGRPMIHCTKRAYIILPADGASIIGQPALARCTPCGENAE